MTQAIIHDHVNVWQDGIFAGTRTAANDTHCITLSPGETAGSFTSASIQASGIATEAILSVNLRQATLLNCGLKGELSCSEDGDKWSDWFCMFNWGLDPQPEFEPLNRFGQVAVDTLKLSSKPRYWRYKISLHSPDGAPGIRRIVLSLWSPPESNPSKISKSASIDRLEVPFVSQWNIREHDGSRVCSPAAICMLSRFLGLNTDIEEMAARAYDTHYEIYGNWSLNMIAASLDGLRAYVDRADSLAYLEHHVANGHPVVTSIAYTEGNLGRTPVKASEGHLVVVAGFSEQGDLVVRDPAANGSDVWITYDREEFSRAWLGHGGVVYRIEPEDE